MSDVRKAIETITDEDVANNPRDSVQILRTAAKLQTMKARDYQNDKSTITQADYYPRGLYTLLDIIYAKYLRANSIIEAMHNDPASNAQFESLQDTFIDIINYASFAASWSTGTLEGQDLHRCGLLSNRPVENPVGVSKPKDQYYDVHFTIGDETQSFASTETFDQEDSDVANDISIPELPSRARATVKRNDGTIETSEMTFTKAAKEEY